MSRRPFGGAYFAGEGAMRKIIAALLVLALPWAASAQVVTSGNGPSVMVTGTNASGATVTMPIPATVTVGTNGTVVTGSTPTGPAGTPNTNVVTVQGIGGGTPINVSQSSAATQTDYSTGSVALAAPGATATLGPTTGVSFGLLRIDAIATATVNVQGSFDNITWSALAVANIGQAPSTSPLTTVGNYGVSGASGFPYLRVIQNGAGSATVFLRATGASGTKFVWSLLADGFKAQVNGAATTAAPGYTTGTTNPLSLNLAGGLRVDGSGVTQPVSIATMPSTPVTGTFFQGTQPVSIATMPSTPVTGAFFQTTQPVSLASTTLTGTSAVSLATLPALTTGAAVIGAVTQSGTWNVGSITTLPALATGANVIGGVTQSGTWNIGTVTTLPALATGANTIGAVNIAAAQTVAVTQATAANLNATVVQATPANLQVTETPATPTAFILNSAATTNATSVKASAGTIYSITISNVGAAAVFVKIYNLATTPTVGTSTIALTIPVAASGVANIQFAATGMRFGTGIALATTNLVADTDTTVVAAGQIKVLMSYL